jgi:two-component system sensor histidine kinase KdpD
VTWRELAPGLLRETFLAAALVIGTTVLVAAVESVSPVPNISNLYIIAIAVLASRRGPYAAFVAAIMAFLTYDWFFVPPEHKFTVDDPSEYVALLTLLATIVIIGQLVAVARRRTEEVRGRQRQTQLLYDVSQAALSSPRISTVYPMALWRLNETLGLRGSRLFLKAGNSLRQVAASGSIPELGEERSWLEQVGATDGALVVWAQSQNKVRVAEEFNWTEERPEIPDGAELVCVMLPLRIERELEGVLVVGERKDHSPIVVEDRHLLRAFTNQLAVAVDRQRRAEQQARAQALEESDRMKSALVSSVSHELKTPLAAIKASVTTLLESGSEANPTMRRELAESIDREADRLTRLVSNLLDMSRLEAGALRPQVEWVSIADVVADVLDRMEPILSGHAVRLELAETLPLTPMDFVQISQVLTNLLDNAVRYSPPLAPIEISAEVVGEHLRVTVFNAGSRIPPDELPRLFDKFHRLSETSGGIGLGLTIARGIVDAHGGRIWAENVGREGVAFTFVLPSPTRPPDARDPRSAAVQAAV